MGLFNSPIPYLPPQKKETVFHLPPRNGTNERVYAYLMHRGIDREVIDYAVSSGILYEGAIHHNAVFVGRDYAGVPSYACLRSTGQSKFRGEAAGSKKQFGFRMEGISGTLHVFEAAIDLLSYLCLQARWGRDWTLDSYLSLGGITNQQSGLPPALAEYLRHFLPKAVILHLDNDDAGRSASEKILERLPEGVLGKDSPAPLGKDINDYLCILKRQR